MLFLEGTLNLIKKATYSYLIICTLNLGNLYKDFVMVA